MNKNSYICNLISDYPDAWRDICSQKKIKVKEDGDLAIFNYDIMADFSDPVVQEARGIIINLKDNTVACWPFRKFMNWHEPHADNIDWASAKIQEKVDGSIVKLWYNKVTSKWQWSSNSCIDAKNAKLLSLFSIIDLIECTKEYKEIKKQIWKGAKNISTDYTYIFELVGPYNQIVIHYDKPALYHIGTRNNKTGTEMELDLGIQKPKSYPLHSLNDCINAAANLNKGDYPENEGFVVVDKDWHRIKIKSPEYLIYHHAVNNGVITKEKAWEILHTDDFNLEAFCKAAQDHAVEAMTYYKDQLDTARVLATQSILIARQMQNIGLDRKEIAARVKESKYAFFAFKGLDENLKPNEIVTKYEKTLLKIIKDYEYL